MTEKTVRVVVIGGGYAGVMAANRLQGAADAPGTAVTLINARAAFVERIRLHQLAADRSRADTVAVHDFTSLLNPGVQLVVDSAERINAAARTVALSSGATLAYDYLVYAVGSTGAVPAGVPGARRHAHPLSELEQAQRLQARLADLSLSEPIVVVGGGLTGIEAAAEFAEAGRPVTLVGELGPSLSDPGRRSVAKRLRRLGVAVVETMAVEVTASDVTLADGRKLASAATVWTAGLSVPGLAADSGLPTDGLGRLLTDETLTSIDNRYIVAAGDAAAPSGLPFRMSCQAALPLGAQAANTILSRIDGSVAADVSVPMSGQCISLGRSAGTVQLQHSDDTPRNLYIGGRSGAFMKEQVCRWTLKWLRGEAAKPGSYTFFKGPDRSVQLAALGARTEQPSTP